LTPSPEDGCRFAVIDRAGNFETYPITIHGNGRNIEEASSVSLATNNLTREWFYRADLGNWVRVTDLTVNDESPFPEEFDDLLVIMLAFRLNPRYGAETRGETAEALNRARRQFRARYRQKTEVDVEDALIRGLSNHRYWFGDGFMATDRFNYGID
jgi:hypothetical protein